MIITRTTIGIKLKNMERILLNGLKALVTAGPTYERIDPVRFIGNFSTGKMGIELAYALYELGCEVTLVLGPTHLNVDDHIYVIRVESANDMYIVCMDEFQESDIIVCSAAVADFRPANKAENKIKKGKDEGMSIDLVRTVDILHEMGLRKNDKQVLVGFALETQDALNYARKKLEAKNADMIVMNVPTKDTGFGTDTNKVSILCKGNENPINTELLSKKDIARVISNIIEEVYSSKN